MKTFFRKTGLLLMVIALIVGLSSGLAGCKQKHNTVQDYSEEEAEPHGDTGLEWQTDEPINPRANELDEELGQLADEPAVKLVEPTE
jgi:hypothetical protein